MATLLHMSFRVKNPERSAALYAELLNGTATDPGPVLRPAGVKAVHLWPRTTGPFGGLP